mmetsp:Transcript_68359/g.182126  ORF Transcript_68359/g.182126 Transcript_68359/m.182126 type:complete len:525 (+) Transcript_68359:13-1587(+)
MATGLSCYMALRLLKHLAQNSEADNLPDLPPDEGMDVDAGGADLRSLQRRLESAEADRDAAEAALTSKLMAIEDLRQEVKELQTAQVASLEVQEEVRQIRQAYEAERNLRSELQRENGELRDELNRICSRRAECSQIDISTISDENQLLLREVRVLQEELMLSQHENQALLKQVQQDVDDPEQRRFRLCLEAEARLTSVRDMLKHVLDDSIKATAAASRCEVAERRAVDAEEHARRCEAQMLAADQQLCSVLSRRCASQTVCDEDDAYEVVFKRESIGIDFGDNGSQIVVMHTMSDSEGFKLVNCGDLVTQVNGIGANVSNWDSLLQLGRPLTVSFRRSPLPASSRLDAVGIGLRTLQSWGARALAGARALSGDGEDSRSASGAECSVTGRIIEDLEPSSNQPYFRLIKSSIQDFLSSGGADSEEGFEIWLRSFHSERGPEWYKGNHVRLLHRDSVTDFASWIGDVRTDWSIPSSLSGSKFAKGNHRVKGILCTARIPSSACFLPLAMRLRKASARLAWSRSTA